MADSQQLELISQGVSRWNEWRGKNPLQAIDLNGVDLNKAGLRKANLSGANLGGASLAGADLRSADLDGANLTKATLTKANLGGANLRGVDLTDAVLILTRLDRTNLRNGNLSGARLNGASLSRADLEGAILVGTHLRGADLSDVNLSGADLGGADFSDVNLMGADLSGANLSSTNLNATDLRLADFTDVHFFETIFANAVLTGTLGLDKCHHLGPSILDHRTLLRSGTLPLAFLRGCGLPEALITYLPSILNQPIQFYSCFISYSTLDQSFAERIHSDLQNKGVRCWFAPHDIQGGKKIHEQIDEAIRVYDRLLLILSDASMNSEWVKTEIAHARQKELNQKRQVLFPISLVPHTTVRQWKCFDADTGKDSGREIREYFIPDFSEWKSHDQYQTAFDRLARDLKTEA